MLTSNNREQFFKQLEIILDGIKQNLNIVIKYYYYMPGNQFSVS
jgi:hypothetical protein